MNMGRDENLPGQAFVFVRKLVERAEKAEAIVAKLEAKCRRLEGQPREAWESRQLVSGCKSMVVDVWFPMSTAPNFDGECILLPDQSGRVPASSGSEDGPDAVQRE